mmetsp:Transcript_51823/g.123306  ORF Transcript_51823/g.123306 Transcript_51823/m.123306 type:complete len:103 (+) Transcript_51823:61-369(+)
MSSSGASRSSKRASTAEVPAGLKVQRMSSFDEASKTESGALVRETSAASLAKDPNVGSFSICWICRRIFPDEEALERHVLYSRLHQDNIRRLGGRYSAVANG